MKEHIDCVRSQIKRDVGSELEAERAEMSEEGRAEIEAERACLETRPRNACLQVASTSNNIPGIDDMPGRRPTP